MRISDWSSDVCSSDLTRAGLSTPNPADPAADEAIVVFDGVCALCSGWVGFLLRHDRARQFRFAAMQDAVGRRLLAEHGLEPDDPMSFLLLDASGARTDSDAIIAVLARLGGAWRAARLLRERTSKRRNSSH